MNIDRTIYEPMLRQTERQLTELDNEKTRLLRVIASSQRELKLLARQRIQCVRAVGTIKDVLQLPLSVEESELCRMPTEKDVEISEDAFKGLTLHDAARKYLSMANRPTTHREVVDALRKGGVTQDIKHLDNSLRSALARRPHLFTFVKDDGAFGSWQLTEWIEGGVEEPSAPASAETRPLRLAVSAS
jgi:hypothetical protein